ncbi:hypothetical protein GF361_00545 [Candidatus Woesearchaeota archaeon]|nr:hypothetical protein [Candidatus Woesearchaeota archaeon]
MENIDLEKKVSTEDIKKNLLNICELSGEDFTALKDFAKHISDYLGEETSAPSFIRTAEDVLVYLKDGYDNEGNKVRSDAISRYYHKEMFELLRQRVPMIAHYVCEDRDFVEGIRELYKGLYRSKNLFL